MNAPAVSGQPVDPATARQTTRNLVASVAFAVLGFFLPFSVAGISIAMGVLLLIALSRPRAVIQSAPWREPVMAAGLVLLAYIALHSLWRSGATRASLEVVNHYHELLIAPLMLVIMRNPRDRALFFRALVVGSVLVAVAYWISLAVPSLYPAMARKRISAGFVLPVTAFLLSMRARGKQQPWPAHATSAFLFLTVLFAMDGRTGHLIVLALVTYAAWLHAPVRWRWAAVIAAPLVVIALAMSSGSVSSRVKEAVAASQLQGPPAEADSTGVRIQLFHVSAELARRYAVAGAGYANFSAAHLQAARDYYADKPNGDAFLQSAWVRSGNPHNEYLMHLISGGIVALALFVVWLGLAFRAAAHAPAPVRAMLAGTVLVFCIGCLFNSLLLDFAEGHFYVAMLGFLLAEARWPTVDRHAQMRRILVIATRQIGDVLLTTPLVHAARLRWPEARIDVVGFEGTLGMLRGNPDVSSLIEVPARPRSATAKLAHQLRDGYDLALVTDPGDRAHLLGWLAAPVRSGVVPEGNRSNWWKTNLLDHVVIAAGDLGERHVTAEKQGLLAPWLGDADGTATRVVPPPAKPLPEDLQAQLQPGAVVVHAPSMWDYKQWPVRHFAALIEGLLAQERQVVLTGSNGARDQEVIALLRGIAPAPGLLDASGRLDFNQLVALFGQAALYIGPDTSVSHLAAATGVPVIAIFGPTNPMRWAPWPAKEEANALFARSMLLQQQGNVTLLQSGLACVPCGRAGCDNHRHSRADCLPDITPERVLEQVQRILE